MRTNPPKPAERDEQAILVALRNNDARIDLNARAVGYWVSCLREHGITRSQGIGAIETYYQQAARRQATEPTAYVPPMTPALLTEYAARYAERLGGYTVQETHDITAHITALYEHMLDVYATHGRQSREGAEAREEWQHYKHSHGRL